MDELKEEQQIAVAETARCGGTKKTHFRRVATKVFEQGYRVCYLLGMQTLRIGRGLARRLVKRFTPAFRAVRRGTIPGSGTIFRMAEAQRMYAAR